MIKLAVQNEDNAHWYSEESDWNTPEGYSIAVWEGCIIRDDEYQNFTDFVKKEAGAEVEPIGSFNTIEGTAIFVFLVKTNISKFSIWRFRLPGMRWWFDTFWETNGGRVAKDSEILPIINKLGLKIFDHKTEKAL